MAARRGDLVAVWGANGGRGTQSRGVRANGGGRRVGVGVERRREGGGKTERGSRGESALGLGGPERGGERENCVNRRTLRRP